MIKYSWEYTLKPTFTSTRRMKEYRVPLPLEIFKNKTTSSLNDTSRKPYIKDGHILFLG